MDAKAFSQYLSAGKALTAKQRKQVIAALTVQDNPVSLLAQVQSREQALDQQRTCIHCGSSGARRHGKSSGLVRFRCQSNDCGKTYTALTNTGLSGLQRREKWELYQQCLQQRMTIQEAADVCGINYRTSFHWRHRTLEETSDLSPLAGVVEMDETFFRASAKGDRSLKHRRQPRKRGKSNRSPQNAALEPVLTAVSRGGETFAWRIHTKEMVPIQVSMQAWTRDDAIVVSDGNPSYQAATGNLGRTHEALNHRRGEFVRGVFHLNTVNNRHQAMKLQLNHRHRGVSTKYLDNYLNWLRLQEFRVDKRMNPDFIRNQIQVKQQ